VETLKQPMEILSQRQSEAMAWIKQFIAEHGMPPTVREIGEALGIKSSSVFDLLKVLERKGYIKRGEMGARSLIVAGSDKATRPDFVEIPIVGRIAAGSPIEAIEHDRRSVSCRRDLLRGARGYALEVVGESMIDAGIHDGDTVIVRKQDTADDGDIVVALIEGDATLKRIYRHGDSVRLEPANKKMKPIFVAAGEFRVQGKVVAVHRTL